MKLLLFVLKNKEEGVEKKEGEGAARNPIREPFFGSAGIRVSSQTASPLAPWGRCRARRLPRNSAISPNTCAIDYSPVRRYSSRHRKRLKFLYVPRSEHEHMDIVIIGG